MAISLDQKAPALEGKPLIAPKKRGAGKAGVALPAFGGKIKPLEILFFASQLSLMLEINTPVDLALTSIGDQTQNKAFKDVIRSMVEDIQGGLQLSEAMKKHSQVFGSVTTSMVRAGETGGFLKPILDRLIEILEKRQALKTQLRAALTYPAVLVVVATLVVIFVLVYVLPKFTGFFAGREDVLPITTKMLMAMSASLKGYWWVYLTASIGVAVGLRFAKKSAPGEAFIDRAIVSGPLVSRLSHKIYTCQLLRTLGSLMDSQVPILEALEVTRGSVGNRYFRKFLDKIIDHVQEGGKFSTPFATYPYTLASVKQMVATGEEAGNLPKVMLRLAEFYDAEVDRELKNLAAMIEPIALIVMGVVVGLIVSSVILPLFKLAHMGH